MDVLLLIILKMYNNVLLQMMMIMMKMSMMMKVNFHLHMNLLKNMMRVILMLLFMDDIIIYFIGFQVVKKQNDNILYLLLTLSYNILEINKIMEIQILKTIIILNEPINLLHLFLYVHYNINIDDIINLTILIHLKNLMLFLFYLLYHVFMQITNLGLIDASDAYGTLQEQNELFRYF